ncbi:uncharacterized protein LOC121388945 isoform X2 [Gigantopelta aegis]|uniref:uncharacterized protein LOC121388945 isoform X2 n=1 Tax=Gigantopelta aegis TaxID=1735272 RepID=UPI001B889227|nr:uncharacterized protein LOC121388945 isoform X2 [Gigantopelta aegis]
MSRYMCGTTSKLMTCLSRPQSISNTRGFVACLTDICYVDRTGGRKNSIEDGIGSTKHRPATYASPADAGRMLQTLFTSVRDVFLQQKGQGIARWNLVPIRGIATQPRDHEIGSGPSPQGVQGEDCAVFLSWIEKCRKYGLENCEDQLQGLQSGRKTLKQVLEEQENLIVEITKKYKEAVAHHTDAEGHYIKGVDEDDYMLDFHSPCTQGIQGSDCDQFKLWLEKCHEFGLMECIDELQGIQSGKKSLQDMFAEHDMLLRKVFKEHGQKRDFSTSARSRRSSQDPKWA